MFGPPGCLTESVLNNTTTRSHKEEAPVTPIPPDWGIFPRIALNLLLLPGCTLHASAIEIYQDVVYDLLNNSTRISVANKVKTPLVTVTGGSVNGVKKGKDGVHLPNCNCGKCMIAKDKATKARIRAIRDMQDEKHRQDLSMGSRGSTRCRNKASVPLTSGNNNRRIDSFSTVGETIIPLVNKSDVAQLARTVELSRIAHGHLLNSRSSRSHCIVRVFIKQRSGVDNENTTRKQQFCFVDLAGSERIHKSGVSGKRQSEALEINQSLSVLGRVIMKLNEREKSISGNGSSHIPFRDSTLTMLLQSSFDGSGNSCTAVVINVSASIRHCKETLSSLRFGAGMAKVKPTVSLNSTRSSGEEERQRKILEGELLDKRRKLKELYECGKGGTFGPGAIPSEKKTFLKNEEILKELSAEKKLTKVRLAEAKSCPDQSHCVKNLETHLSNIAWKEGNIRDITLRQKTIPGFWIPPTTFYKALEADITLLEGQLQTV